MTRMQRTVVLFAIALLAVLAATSVAFAVTRDLWAQFDKAVFQLYQRDWGSLRAICSSGAYWTDESRTRLLTAAHCVDNPKAEYVVSQDASRF